MWACLIQINYWLEFEIFVDYNPKAVFVSISCESYSFRIDCDCNSCYFRTGSCNFYFRSSSWLLLLFCCNCDWHLVVIKSLPKWNNIWICETPTLNPLPGFVLAIRTLWKAVCMLFAIDHIFENYSVVPTIGMYKWYEWYFNLCTL